jgi:hypothetical protein
MTKEKVRVIQDYDKLSPDLKEQVKLVYPDGFSEYLIQFTNGKGQQISALRFETDEKIYMLRMSENMAIQIMEEDDDFDDEFNLKDDIKEVYEEKHSDVDYLSDNENYDDDDD